MEALFTKPPNMKRTSKKGEADTKAKSSKVVVDGVTLSPLVLDTAGPAYCFISEFHTNAKWGTEHTIYISHMGIENKMGKEYRDLTASVKEAVDHYTVMTRELHACSAQLEAESLAKVQSTRATLQERGDNYGTLAANFTKFRNGATEKLKALVGTALKELFAAARDSTPVVMADVEKLRDIAKSIDDKAVFGAACDLMLNFVEESAMETYKAALGEPLNDTVSAAKLKEALARVENTAMPPDVFSMYINNTRRCSIPCCDSAGLVWYVIRQCSRGSTF